MNVQAYILSGIVESYVLGLASPEEQAGCDAWPFHALPAYVTPGASAAELMVSFERVAAGCRKLPGGICGRRHGGGRHQGQRRRRHHGQDRQFHGGDAAAEQRLQLLLKPLAGRPSRREKPPSSAGCSWSVAARASVLASTGKRKSSPWGVPNGRD